MAADPRFRRSRAFRGWAILSQPLTRGGRDTGRDQQLVGPARDLVLWSRPPPGIVDEGESWRWEGAVDVRYDLIDETTIEATPAEVFAALEDEASGRSHWWRPWLMMELDRSGSEIAVGADMTIRISEGGHPERPLGALHLHARVIKMEPDRVITYSLAGPFRGTGEWRFEPLDSRQTRVSLRWRMEPTGLMRLWSRLIDVPSHHSAVMCKGFNGLAEHLAVRRARNAS